MSNQVDVSFFIPIYRPRAQWLREAVESIVLLMRQSKVSTELLLGDDGSPEPVDLESLQALAPERIRVWHFPVNRGVGATSTELSRKARGRYVASFDQDDIMLPFDLDAEVAFMDSHSQYCASYAQKFLFNENGLTGEVHGDIYSPYQAFFSPKININAMLIRCDVLQRLEYFKPLPGSRINHDVWLMLRMSEEGRYYFSRQPRALYRKHGGQASIGDNEKDWLLIGQDIICRHPAEYRELLLTATPSAGRSPKERELFHKLAGLVMYINQRNPVILQKMLLYALKNFPDDFGVWECYLKTLNVKRDKELFFQNLCQAEERFKDDPCAMLVLLREAVACIANCGLNAPDLVARYRELEQRRSTPPPMVADAVNTVLKQEKRTNSEYSFVNRDGTIIITGN